MAAALLSHSPLIPLPPALPALRGEQGDDGVMAGGEAACHHSVLRLPSPLGRRFFAPTGRGQGVGAMRLQKCKTWAEKLALKLKYTREFILTLCPLDV